jgi:hypothetical protein
MKLIDDGDDDDDDNDNDDDVSFRRLSALSLPSIFK